MQIKAFLAGIFLITLLSFLSFFALIFYFDPFQANKIIIILAYLTFLFGLAGFVTLVGFIIRRAFRSKNLVASDAMNSFWQACLLAFAIVSVLVLIAEI